MRAIGSEGQRRSVKLNWGSFLIIFESVLCFISGAPILVPLPGKAKGIATGHSHSVVLLESGEVYTFGKHQVHNIK